MTRLVCPYDTGDDPCPIGPDDRTCPRHLDDLIPAPLEQPGLPPADPPELTEPPRSANDQHPTDPPVPADSTPEPDPEACWRCRRTLPDPAAPNCPRCHAAQPALVLIFSTGTIMLERGEHTRLGRSEDTPHAAILSARNISRVHAVVWVDDDGIPWIKDTDSTNGTFVNGGEALPPEVPCQLTGGTLRLGADNRARVHVRKGSR